MLANEHVYVLRANEKINQKYLFYLLASKKGQEILKANMNGSGIGGINQQNLKNILVPVPPYHIQENLVQKLIEIQKDKETLENKINLINLKKKDLTNNIFSSSKYIKLDSVCELITDGTHNTPQYTKSGIPFLSATNVISKKIDWNNIKYISKNLHNQLSKRVSPKLNDILLAKNGTIGYAAIVDKAIPFDVYVSLAVLRTNNEILPQYLLEILNSETIRNEFLDKIIGMGVPNLHLNKIKEVQVPLINLEEQEYFVEKILALNNEINNYESKITELNYSVEKNIEKLYN